MSNRLVWKGPLVLEKVARATQLAIDDVTEHAALDAESNHWWSNQTANLEANVISEEAQRQKDKIKGKFGTTKDRGFYGLFLELRTPFLRPAADRNFPLLARVIALRMRIGA